MLWELYARTKDPLVIAGVGLVQVLPVVLLFVPSGALVDRGNRQRIATWAVTLTGAIGLGLALISATDAPLWLYFALLLVQGCATSLHAPSSTSLLPMIAERSELPRTAQAFDETTVSKTNIIL